MGHAVRWHLPSCRLQLAQAPHELCADMEHAGAFTVQAVTRGPRGGQLDQEQRDLERFMEVGLRRGRVGPSSTVLPPPVLCVAFEM